MPDLVAAFQTRALPLEAQLADRAGGPGQAQAARAYAVFLEAELNLAYQQMLPLLGKPARAALLLSQRQWLRFRDAEGVFIDGKGWRRRTSEPRQRCRVPTTGQDWSSKG